ncbi:MAG: methyltransferase domain-containing protein [Deltaproteobacteria bacterium]|nr:methyltransferase domain-containing protein [Deltaproteobacteria bacterium]
MAVKKYVPWYVKLTAKLFLSRLPFDYGIWRKVNLFVHGSMHKPDYAYGVFRQHFKRYHLTYKENGFVALEVGPGDSLLSAIVAAAHGARQCYLVDVGAFATQDLTVYHDMGSFLLQQNLSVPDVSGAKNVAEVLSSCHATYLTKGIQSLHNISAESVDFVWSQAVLEHIYRQEFLDTLKELRRILRPDGICSHRIDLKDHLSGSLNNLRFSKSFWESDFIRRSGFYTNRIRYNDMLNYFEITGFDVDVIKIDRWSELPIPRNKLSAEFRSLPEDDLLISGFDVVLTPR